MMAFGIRAMQVIISFLLLSMVFIMVPRRRIERRSRRSFGYSAVDYRPKSPKKLPKMPRKN